MTEPSKTLIGDFVDAVVDDPAYVRRLLSRQPELLNACWILHETVLHFRAVEGFDDVVRRRRRPPISVRAASRVGGRLTRDVGRRPQSWNGHVMSIADLCVAANDAARDWKIDRTFDSR